MIEEITRETLQKYYERARKETLQKLYERNKNGKFDYSKFEFFTNEIICFKTYDNISAIHLGRLAVAAMNAIRNGSVDDFIHINRENYEEWLDLANLFEKYGWIELDKSMRHPYFCFDALSRLLYIEKNDANDNDPIFDEDGILFNEHNLDVLLDWLNEEGKYTFTQYISLLYDDRGDTKPMVIKFSTASELQEALCYPLDTDSVLAYCGEDIVYAYEDSPKYYVAGHTDCTKSILRKMFPYYRYVFPIGKIPLKIVKLNSVGINHWGKHYGWDFINDDGSPVEFITEQTNKDEGDYGYSLFALSKVPESVSQSFAWVSQHEVEFIRMATKNDYALYKRLKSKFDEDDR